MYEGCLQTNSLPPRQRKILLLYVAFRCTNHKKVSKPTKKITDKETTVHPIHCLAVMKLARFVFTHKKTVLLAALFSTCICHGSYEIYAVEMCLWSQLCLCGRINGSIKIMVLPNCTAVHKILLCIIMSSGSIVFVLVGCKAGQV